MKRALPLLLLVGLVANPLPASGSVQEAEEPVAARGSSLDEALTVAAREVALADAAGRELPASGIVQERAGAGWRTVVGIAMIVGGAGIVAKGFNIYQDEPDRFGRTKNADAYVAWGVGGGIITFGFLALKGGLEGRGF